MRAGSYPGAAQFATSILGGSGNRTARTSGDSFTYDATVVGGFGNTGKDTYSVIDEEAGECPAGCAPSSPSPVTLRGSRTCPSRQMKARAGNTRPRTPSPAIGAQRARGTRRDRRILRSRVTSGTRCTILVAPMISSAGSPRKSSA